MYRTGSNLRALVAAAERGVLGGEVVGSVLTGVCPGLDWAAEQGIDTILAVPGGDDATLAETLAAVEADVVVLAGTCGSSAPRCSRRSPGGSST